MGSHFLRRGAFLALFLALLCTLTGPALRAETPDATDVVQDGSQTSSDPGNTPPAMPAEGTGSTAATASSSNADPAPEPASPPTADGPADTPVDEKALRAKAEAAVGPPPAILDLSAEDAAARVFSLHGDLVSVWIATLGGQRDGYGNEISGGYMNARRPDYLDEGLKAFLTKHLAEHPELGLRAAATPTEAAALAARLADERAKEVDEVYRNLLEEAKSSAKDEKASGGDGKTGDDSPAGGSASPGDPKEDASGGASGSEDVPKVPADDGEPAEGSSSGEDGYDPNVLEISVDMNVQPDGLHFGTINVHNKTDGTAGDVYTQLFVDGGKVWDTVGNIPAGGTNPYGPDNAGVPALVPLEKGSHAVRVESWSHNDPRRPKTIWSGTANVGTGEEAGEPSSAESADETPATSS